MSYLRCRNRDVAPITSGQQVEQDHVAAVARSVIARRRRSRTTSRRGGGTWQAFQGFWIVIHYQDRMRMVGVGEAEAVARRSTVPPRRLLRIAEAPVLAICFGERR